MAGRKSGRKQTPTNRFGVEDGNAHAVAGDSNTTAAGPSGKNIKSKSKDKAKKKVRKVRYDSSSDHTESSEAVSTDDSRETTTV